MFSGSDHHNTRKYRWIPATEAAALIGIRFHPDWSEEDLNLLIHREDSVSDKEAWRRAKHVQDVLYNYIVSGFVALYTKTDDGDAMTDIPLHWLTSSSFEIDLQKGCCLLDANNWEEFWVDHKDLIDSLPKDGLERKKNKFEWDKIVHEAWMFALRQDGTPTKAEVVRHLGEWCPVNNQQVPDGSSLSKVARTVIDFLNENKAGWRNSNSKNFEYGAH